MVVGRRIEIGPVNEATLDLIGGTQKLLVISQLKGGMVWLNQIAVRV